MPLRIRLARAGAKKRPFFHIVVADSRSPRDGRFIERIGHYNPMLPKDSPERVKVNGERVQHWLKCGALPSERVHLFLFNAQLMKDKPVIREQPKRSAPRKKAQERMKAAAEAAGKAEGAAA
jgi:small subunit ribosomal protein S16